MKKFAFILLISPFIIFYCSSKDSNKKDNIDLLKIINENKIEKINDFILNKLNSNQVILLGESKHNQKVYSQTVIEFLNYWLDQIASDDKSIRKIGLILEIPHYFGEKLYSFFHNGDMSQLSWDSRFILNATVADLDFYQDLKDLIKRIDLMNNKNLKKDLIEFKVICPEKDIPMMASRELRAEFFETERDIYTANIIEEKIKEFPDYKFIGTFGGFHIAKKRALDDKIPRLAEQLISKNIKIYTICRTLLTENPFGIAFDSNQRDFILSLNVTDDLNLNIKSDVIDAWIFYNASYFDDIIINNIPSINLIKNYIDYAKQYPDSYSSPLFWFWHRFTGEMVPRSQNLAEYIASRLTFVNTIEIVEDLSLFENIFNAFERLKMPAQEIKNNMTNLTGYSEYNELFFIPNDSTAIEYWKKYINENSKKIKLRLLTSILYYGTEIEQFKAFNKLKELTGKHFNSRKEWLNWYRENSN